MFAPYSLKHIEIMLHCLPPLVPQSIQDEMVCAIKLMRQKGAPTRDVDRALVEFGEMLFPYMEAYKEFERAIFERRGEDIFTSLISNELKDWYGAYKHHGGSIRDLMLGRGFMVLVLEPENRQEIAAALAETKRLTRDAAQKEIVGANKREFERRIMHHEEVLRGILQHLDALQKLALELSYNHDLRDEILKTVHEARLGLAGVHEFIPHNLQRLHEYYRGKVEEKTF